MINQKQPTHKILLNVNAPPLVKTVTDLQSVFKDITCRDCITCMERAIKAHKINLHVLSYQSDENEFYYDVLNNERRKRNTAIPEDWERKIKEGKSIMGTVTKYTKERKVFAIKVKEIIENDRTSCKLYSVKKSLPCESGLDIISASKRSTNKKSKKITEIVPTNTATTERVQLKTSVYKKREVDNSQVSESFMPSIEEMY